MIARRVLVFEDDFNRAQSLATAGTPGMNGWTSKITKTAGSPTALCVSSDGGQIKFTMTSTSEVQVLSLYQNDVLCYSATSLQLFEAILAVGGVAANTTVAWGLGTAENDTPTSMSKYILFLINGATSLSNVVISASDGTNTYSNIATGITLGATFKDFVIDFQNGTSDVRFFADGARVGTSKTFNLSAFAATDLLQPIVQIGKASSTDAGNFQLDFLKVQSRFTAGA